MGSGRKFVSLAGSSAVVWSDGGEHRWRERWTYREQVRNALQLLSLYYRVEYAEVNLLPCSQVTLQADDTA